MKKKEVKRDSSQKNIGGGINCSIFLKQELTIRSLTDKINKSQEIEDKSRYAEELLKELNVIPSCPNYQSENSDCRNCHLIINLRKRTADLIIKANELA